LDLVSGGELAALPGWDVRAEGLALHPQGRWLATCEEARVRLWDLGPTPFARPPSPARELDVVELPERPGSLAWHPHEPRLAMACQHHGLFLKEPGLPLAVPQGTGAGLTQVLFGPDGDLLLTGAHGGSTVVSDAVELRPLLVSSEGFAVRLSRDGRQLAFAGESRGIGVRPVHWPAGWRRLVVPADLGGNTAAILFLRGGRWMVSSHPFGLAFWETDRAAVGRRLALFQPRLAGVLTNKTALLLGTGEGPALLPIGGAENRPPEPGELRLVRPGAWVGFDRVALAPDGDTLAAGGEDGLILTRLSDPGQQTVLAGSERPVNYVGFSADGRWLVTGHFRRDGLEVYDVLVGQHSRHLSTGSGAFAFSPDGLRLLHTAASGYGYRRVGTWETLFRRDFAPGASELMLGNGFIDLGRLALFSDRQARLNLRGVVEDRPLATFEAFEPTATWGVAADPTGRRLATWSSRRVIHLWDLETLRDELERLSPGWTADWPAAR
jgi:WD40 repeat protein